MITSKTWEIILNNGSILSEENLQWVLISQPIEVRYLCKKKMVHICKFDVKIIKCYLENLEAKIEVPEGYQCYQATRAEAVITSDKSRKDRILGKLIGIVKDGEVIEEKFLNGVELKVEGFRK